VTIYIDDMRRPARVGSLRGIWSHLFTDSVDQTALHEFAAALGLKRGWFQVYERTPWMNHYDVTDSVRRKAIQAGATEVVYITETGAIMRRTAEAHRAATP
jgi:hypothetical protein